jgi:hypothetical protein
MSPSNDTDSSFEEGEDGSSNYAHFRDCLSTELLRPPPPTTTTTQQSTKSRRRGRTAKRKSANTLTTGNRVEDAAELAEFIDYLATEIFEGLPKELQDVDYRSWRDNQGLQSQYALPLTASSLADLNLPPNVTETLETYNLISSAYDNDKSTLPASTESFLLPIIAAYLEPLITPPPATTATRTEACEICGRWWINLSYHHLIPRFVHDKVVKRGWHRKEDLQNVAWLCGACHRFVHQFRGHEDLARDYYTVDLLLEDEEVQKWANWVGKMRWKGGGGRRRALK